MKGAGIGCAGGHRWGGYVRQADGDTWISRCQRRSCTVKRTLTREQIEKGMPGYRIVIAARTGRAVLIQVPVKARPDGSAVMV